MNEQFSNEVVQKALLLGFDLAGIIAVQPPPHRNCFESWLEKGMHGRMEYLARNFDKRLDPTRLHPGTRTIVAVAMSYRPRDDDGRPHAIARYAWGRDYHKILRRKLSGLGEFIVDRKGPAACEPRAFVDSAPILERDLAQIASIGWFGKNASIIHPKRGSYLFLGELFLGHLLEPLGSPLPDRCGSCRACIEACPTGALVEPFVIDSRRCISYLTIELKGAVPIELRPLMGSQLFGCDLCQSVCPWNRKAEPLREPAFEPRKDLDTLTPYRFLAMSKAEFNSQFRGSALRRAGRAALARNAAIALGNSAEPQAIDPLATALRTDSSPLVRGHAAWALSRFHQREAITALDVALRGESDRFVQTEIQKALEILS